MGARVLYVSEDVRNVETDLSHLEAGSGKDMRVRKTNGWRLMFEEQA